MDKVNAQPTAEQIAELLALRSGITPLPWGRCDSLFRASGNHRWAPNELYSIVAANLAPALARRVIELEQRIADLTAPLSVKCEKCGGEGSRVTERRLLAIEGENRGLESVIASQRRALDEAEARERNLRKALAAVRAENQFQNDYINAALASPEEPK